MAFPYLVLTVAFNNSDWAAMYSNMSKLQWQWDVVAKVLMNTGYTVQSWVMMYKALVHTVLLYGR